MGVDGCWCAPRSSKPLQVVRSCPGGFDSHILSPTGTGAAALLRFLCISTPRLHLHSAASLFHGGAFWRSTNTAYSAVPLRGAIVSMGLRGSPGGLRGEIEIFPGPLAKKVIKLLAVLFACFTPSGCSFHSHPPPSTGRLFSIAKLRMCFPNIPRIIANMLKLTSISCFSIVMPIYIDNLMIMGYLITIRRGLRMKEINSFG